MFFCFSYNIFLCLHLFVGLSIFEGNLCWHVFALHQKVVSATDHFHRRHWHLLHYRRCNTHLIVILIITIIIITVIAIATIFSRINFHSSEHLQLRCHHYCHDSSFLSSLRGTFVNLAVWSSSVYAPSLAALWTSENPVVSNGIKSFWDSHQTSRNLPAETIHFPFSAAIQLSPTTQTTTNYRPRISPCHETISTEVGSPRFQFTTPLLVSWQPNKFNGGYRKNFSNNYFPARTHADHSFIRARLPRLTFPRQCSALWQMYYSVTAALIASVLGILSKQKCRAKLANMCTGALLLWVAYSERHFSVSHSEEIERTTFFYHSVRGDIA